MGVCNDIDKLCRDFLWGDMEDRKKVHPVNWTEVCTPRDKGGLGLRMAREVNLAFLGKLAWQMIDNEDKLWVQVMKSKYIKDNNFFTVSVQGNASLSWRSIVKSRSVIEQGARWRVGDGRNLNVCSDWWMGDKPLGIIEEIDIPENMACATVSEFILNSREWVIDKLQNLLPIEVVNSIRAVLIPLSQNVRDKLEWPLSGTTFFSICFAYHLIARNFQREDALH